MRRLAALLAALLLAAPALAEPAVVLPGSKLIRSYESETLNYTIERFLLDGVTCYLTRVTMADPGRQIRKATAKWRKDIRVPSEIAKRLDSLPALVINGSGYVSPTYPGIPDNYPGVSRDYFYTSLGSLVITDGEVKRNLEGVDFYGLTLQKDGLHLHVGERNEDVLAQEPSQSWAFYVKCPLIRDGEIILDREWEWANRKALRNIIMDMGGGTYLDLMVTDKSGRGLTVVRCTDFIQETFHPLWAYNLDGGPSVALLARKKGDRKLKTVYGNNSKDFDIMAFYELED